MESKFIEVSNGPRNWGKFMLGRFERAEWDRTSNLPDAEERAVFTHGKWSLLRQRGWTSNHLLVVDLETGEGAIFLPGGLAKADLDKHKIWVCPMFEPFLEWLYGQDLSNLDALPAHVDLPDAPFAMAGYRREGRPEPYESDVEIERLRALDVDECEGCEGGRSVRYCPIHGLHGIAPR